MTTVLGLQNALSPFQGGGIIVLQVRVTDRFREEAGAAAKDEVRGVRDVCNGMALREVRQEGILIKAAELGDGFQQGILCNGVDMPVEDALVQRQPEADGLARAHALLIEGGIASVLAYLKNHREERLRLEDVARAFFVTPAYLSRSFKACTGLSFVTYLNHLKVERAKELLLREGSVTQVSLELGYESLTHFERVFRQIAGLSPTEWRKSQRPGEDKIS